MAETLSESPVLDVAILGAGISGLLAARTIQASGGGRTVAVFDKGRGVGGRMSTRRVGEGTFDHGAQYFTARDPVFRTLVDGWLVDGLIHLWSDGFATASGAMNQNGEPRYMGSRGMTTIPKRLAQGLEVSTGATAQSCRWANGRWEIVFKERAPVRARSLVLTCPVPQSVALLGAGGADGAESGLDNATDKALRRIEYAPCLAALLQLDGASRVPKPGGLWLEGEPVGWVADNVQKGISPAAAGAALTVHAGPKFSREFWDADPDDTARRLAGAVEKWLGSAVMSVQLHRWRYSTPTVVHPERCLIGRAPGWVVFAGDAFAGPRVEGAALSGMAAGEAVLREG